MKIVVHTDGACSGNPGPGGWAATIASGEGGPILLTGGDPQTTNNIMELTGAAEAMAYLVARPERLPAGSEVVLRLDSEYVIKGMQDWMPAWKRSGWRAASGKPVKNREIWERIDALQEAIKARASLTLSHVRGHSGDPENDAVDKAAVASRERSFGETGAWMEKPSGPACENGAAKPSAEAAEALNMSVQDLQDAAESRGYKRYLDSFHGNRDGYLFSLQKRIKEGASTLYFVNIDVWRPFPNQTVSCNLEAHVQFHTRDDMQGDYVNIRRTFKDFGEAESFFHRMWETMGFGAYEREVDWLPENT